ncbi:MAG: lysine--tRNA ligase [Acidimicrobiales bacterium]|nr:lysine--tRNA ligase [Acidimicrobiales bacterium]
MSGAAPYRFEKTDDAAGLRARYGSLGPDQETGSKVAVAGRVMLARRQGGVAFFQLRDWTGQVQLYAGVGFTARFEDFSGLSLGDWVGVEGEVVTTRRGELSVKVADWVLLAPARQGFGDKWRGVSDPETRFRQRYVDLWAGGSEQTATGPRETLLLRSRMVALMRRYLEDRGFVEVETPVLQPIPGGAAVNPFVTHHRALDAELYLRVAPELYLKRLVVGGLERVYEIGRVFRNEGLDPRHNPEFTMLEAYQAYADYTDMMSLIEELVASLAMALLGTTTLPYGGRQVELATPWQRATLVELVEARTGLALELDMGAARLREAARSLGVPVEERWGPGQILFTIYEKTTEPGLWGPVHVCDYPKEVSPLAREHRQKPGYVERFESVVAGRELANAYSELTDPDEQRSRLVEQAALRAAGDEEAMPVDQDYLRALEHGLPPTGGLGLGVDRLAMLFTGAPHIREVIAFPAMRPEQGRPEPGNPPPQR